MDFVSDVRKGRQYFVVIIIPSYNLKVILLRKGESTLKTENNLIA